MHLETFMFYRTFVLKPETLNHSCHLMLRYVQAILFQVVAAEQNTSTFSNVFFYALMTVIHLLNSQKQTKPVK